MTLQAYEARRGEMIFARRDVRDREDYQAQAGMYGRITNSFFEDLGKKIRWQNLRRVLNEKNFRLMHGVADDGVCLVAR